MLSKLRNGKMKSWAEKRKYGTPHSILHRETKCNQIRIIISPPSNCHPNWIYDHTVFCPLQRKDCPCPCLRKTLLPRLWIPAPCTCSGTSLRQLPLLSETCPSAPWALRAHILLQWPPTSLLSSSSSGRLSILTVSVFLPPVFASTPCKRILFLMFYWKRSY